MKRIRMNDYAELQSVFYSTQVPSIHRNAIAGYVDGLETPRNMQYLFGWLRVALIQECWVV